MVSDIHFYGVMMEIFDLIEAESPDQEDNNEPADLTHLWEIL